ncbi:NmrA family NAD(P)-binding protein [Patulibacter americanus]|uniref:NmrA family NAD(P)-binding protein n=1 Tax=Patulibacter americanus TaxID=588672 RepID=UPI0003B38287|nr:NmrA family NAD(P)-binding protein [Patulibacter americanus]
MSSSPAPSSPDPAAGGPVLVLGATGTQGGAVAHALLGAGVGVRALVRDPASARAAALADAGAELVRGDLTDEASLERAFADVGRVYAVTTPFGPDGAAAEVEQGAAIVRAAEAVGLDWLLLASVASAGRAPVPHFESKARIEAALRASDVPWTVIAPSYFYENVLGAARDAAASGELPLPLPSDVPLHQVALADLGGVVAAVLGRRDEHLGHRVEVAGDAPTPAEMAAAFGAHHVWTSLDEVRARSADLGAMYTFLTDPGYGIDVAAVRARYPEVEWTRFADWAAGVVGDGGAPGTGAGTTA